MIKVEVGKVTKKHGKWVGKIEKVMKNRLEKLQN